MNAILGAILLLALSGVLAGMTGRFAKAPGRIAMAGLIGATVLGLYPSVPVLLGKRAPLALSLPWDVPGGAFTVGLDALSAFFLAPMLILSLLFAAYGVEYLRAHASSGSLGGVWRFYNLLVASMALVLVARNAVLFLVAWEVMALASFFLVAFEDERAEVRKAAWVYLIATHLGAAALFIMFVLLGGPGGSMEFAALGQGLSPRATTAAILLAVIGFGAKAGFAPFHVWLPDAHPVAPSHVSALMSGLMIKTGIYGLIRILLCLGVPPFWWGALLIAIGAISGVGGVLFALAQHDLKRLLAYSSIENIGIITLGLGLGLVGWTTGNDQVSLLGFAGGLLHILNHSLFKGLLFLGAGATLHATQTRDMDHLGGLLKRMPQTGATFLTGSMAISGLPPFNGFVSEFLIFLGALTAVLSHDPALWGAGATVIAGLALISGLAAACFSKAFGAVFLGEPRSDLVRRAHDPGLWMRGPMWALTFLCLAIGLGAPWMLAHSDALLATLRPDAARSTTTVAQMAGPILLRVTGAFALLIALSGALGLLRARLLRRRDVATTVTWDCGYAAPTARMQYTSSSFAQPLTDIFSTILRTRRRGAKVSGLFPQATSFETKTPDVCAKGFYRPFFARLEWVALRLHRLQHGNIHLYVLYIAATLVVLLLWKLR